MRDMWLYIIMGAMLVILVLSLLNMYNKVPKKMLADSKIVTHDSNKFIRSSNFVGVERSNIIFKCTKKGE